MYQKKIYTPDELRLKEENRKLKDAIKTIKWGNKNKEKKSDFNKEWRQKNDNAAYLKRYRKLAAFKAALSNYNFYGTK